MGLIAALILNVENVLLSVTYAYVIFLCHCADCHNAECHYAECHYAECHSAECPLLTVFMPSVLAPL
jgi:hypothetical protein